LLIATSRSTVSLSSDLSLTSQPGLTGSERWRKVARAHRGAIGVGAVFLILTLVYNVAVPLWESDNEWAHYQYIRYIATQRSLPVLDTQIAVPATGDLCSALPEGGLATVHQFRQPPLYYLLGTLAVAGIDVAADLPVVSNPHVHAGQSEGGLNVVVHSEAEHFPYQGTVLAVHRLRLLSGLIGLAGLVATYLSGLLLFPQRRYLAVAMMAVNAFIPQVIFSASVVNNDILVAALGSWCIFLCLYYVLRKPNPIVLALAVLAASLGIMAKYSGLVLAPVIGATLAISLGRSWRQDRARFGRELGQILMVLGLASAPVVFWLARNRLLYGHLFAAYADVTNFFVQDASPDPSLLGLGGLSQALYAARFALMTFWGLFGNDNLALPQMVVILLQGVFLVSVLGAVLVAFDRRQPVHLRAAVATALLIVVAAWFVNVVKAAGTGEPRGRYFLPIYAIVSFLLVLGIDRALPARWRRWGAALLPGFLLTLSIVVPLLLLRPTYAPPPIETTTALRPGEEPANVIFGDFAELLGYRIEPQRIGLYESVEVTLVWRALEQTSNNYTVGVHLLDGANVSHDRQTRFPGGGNLATSLWKPGDVFRDTYRVGLAPAARDSLPSLGRIKVAMYCYSQEEDRHLPVKDQQGNSLGDAVYLGRLKLAGEVSAQQAGSPAPYTFGDEIALEHFSFTPQVFPFAPEFTIELHWRALAQLAQDYTVFAHLVDAHDVTVFAYDLPLTDGYYPSSLWDAGERVIHTHRLPLISTLLVGEYTLRIGLYDPRSGVRLPAVDVAGVEQPNGVVLLGTIEYPDRFTFVPLVWHNQTLDSTP
jgi:hypothetical protein